LNLFMVTYYDAEGRRCGEEEHWSGQGPDDYTPAFTCYPYAAKTAVVHTPKGAGRKPVSRWRRKGATNWVRRRVEVPA
jgi:hypothetical protein